MDLNVCSLTDVLAIAEIHPFYNREREYPPDASAIQVAREQAAEQSSEVDPKYFPLLWKKHLYATIERLVDDTSSENTCTTSQSLGALFFATDTEENRRLRARYSQFLRETGVVTTEDWILTVNKATGQRRSWDLAIVETLENAGAYVLSAGDWASSGDVSKVLAKYHINVLTGDSSQILQIVHHISTAPRQERNRINLHKIIYTSEVLTPAQRSYIGLVLGPIKICSMFANAEAGPWAASNPDVTREDTSTGSVDLIFDTRTMLIEIFSSTCTEDDSSIPNPLPDGEQGLVVQTSLARLKNPLVRYVTGDVGSLHSIPNRARNLLPKTSWHHFRILRVTGRDRRISFKWDGRYIELEDLASFMGAESAILQWQVILGKMKLSQDSLLEVRVLCVTQDRGIISTQKAISDRITTFLHVYDLNSHMFRLKFVESVDGFERSGTECKVFIDRYSGPE
ncbi:hypothetical protein F4679DRAFT_575119 [Xylaria curta]|nr:hypothetical protein F4679DRAFT_575119 [Xylaria curta]